MQLKYRLIIIVTATAKAHVLLLAWNGNASYSKQNLIHSQRKNVNRDLRFALTNFHLFNTYDLALRRTRIEIYIHKTIRAGISINLYLYLPVYTNLPRGYKKGSSLIYTVSGGGGTPHHNTHM